MKKLNIKIKPETAVSVALGILGIAQMLLTNKKDANDKAQLKEEILTEVLKETTSETKQKGLNSSLFYLYEVIREKINHYYERNSQLKWESS